MSGSTDPKQFWEDKILDWESGRYGQSKKASSLLERLADRASDSLRFRLFVTKELLRPFVGGKAVVELGCGSGLIASDLLEMGASSYHGYDISEKAVANARALADERGYGPNLTFEVCPVESLPPLKTDIVFSLGLLDWLDDAALAHVYEVAGSADYLHAISEKRIAVSQILHRLYVYLSYGWRTGAYIPRYYTAEGMKALAAPYHPEGFHVYRNPKLSFGALVSSLPLEEAAG